MAAHEHEIHRWWITAVLCVCAAGSFAVIFPGVGLWFAAPLPVLFLTLAAVGAGTWKRGALCAYLSHVPVWLALHVWLIDVTAVGWPSLGILLAVYSALFIILTRIGLRSVGGRLVHLVWIVPVVWTALEYIRGSLFMDGYPWYLIGAPLIECPLLVQTADIFGAYFATFVTAFLGGALATSMLLARGGHGSRAGAKLPIVIAAGVLVLNIGYGWWRISTSPDDASRISVLAIQTNLPQSNKQKWEPREQIRDVGSFIAVTMEAWDATTQPVDVIVWPETMVPGHGFEPASLAFQEAHGYFPGERWLHAMQELRSEVEGTPLLVGSPARIGLGIEQTPEGEQWTWERSYNSAYLIDADEPPFQRYDKVFLTPFGETMPYISRWSWLEQKLLALGAAGMTFDLDQATTVTRIKLPASAGPALIATPICFEDTVPSVCRRLVYDGTTKQAQMLINLSNDGWFGASDANRMRHLQLARFRCIENRVPMVRVANTGVTAWVDSNGKIIQYAGEGRKALHQVPAWLHAEPRFDHRTTLYARVGNVFPQACLVGTIGLFAFGTWRSTRVKKLGDGTCEDQ